MYIVNLVLFGTRGYAPRVLYMHLRKREFIMITHFFFVFGGRVNIFFLKVMSLEIMVVLSPINSKMRSYPVKKLARSFGSDRQTSCYFIIRTRVGGGKVDLIQF